VHVQLWYHVGSKNEKPGRTGFAHLFEHLMFKGSKNAKEEYFNYAEKAGANLFEGGVNGTTSQDRTNYFATVHSGNLENLLWLESDRLATLTDALTKEKLDNQRDVVKNERRQGLERLAKAESETFTDDPEEGARLVARRLRNRGLWPEASRGDSSFRGPSGRGSEASR
jgi:predicted Zn-dependent peptidase